MVMNLRNSENGGSFSREHKGAGLISRLSAVIKHIGTLLTVPPAQYNIFPTPEQFERMKKNQGCGPSGGNDNRYTEEQARNDAHREAVRNNRDAEKKLIKNGSRPR